MRELTVFCVLAVLNPASYPGWEGASNFYKDVVTAVDDGLSRSRPYKYLTTYVQANS